VSSENKPFLPYGKQDIDQSDIDAVSEVLRGDWLTTGPAVERFEEALSARVGAPHVVSCSNGTTALHLAALACGLGPGKIAIVPAVTFQATASAVLHTEAEVVFADVNPDTALMEAGHVEDAISRAKRGYPEHVVSAVLPVHMAGLSADVKSIAQVAKANGLAVIEDAAHALGSSSDGGKGMVGDCRYSDVATFSFHPVKTVTTGEGGAVSTNDASIADTMRKLRNHGITRNPEEFLHHDDAFEDGALNPWYYEVGEIGFNYRICDLQCALGLSQLKRLDQFIDRRAELRRAYCTYFQSFEGVDFVMEGPQERVSWHLAVALIDFARFGVTRGEVMRRLSAAGIGSQVHYMPLYRHPVHQQRAGGQTLPGAEAYYERALSLPLFSHMTTDDVQRVCQTITEILTA
jgi:UDP-4-amino-4,6-dideoxy-N-acetyl-beta-L-altrosamine transaminase